MKIDRVVFCLNSSPTYSFMWDIVSEAYAKNTDFIPTLIFCGTEEELHKEVQSDFGEVFLMPRYEEVICNWNLDWSAPWTAFWAMANMFPDDVCLFSGIDEIPISDKLWNKISEFPDDKYIVGLGPTPYSHDRCHIASGHNCAKGKVFKDVLEIRDELEAELKDKWENRFKLAEYITAWNMEKKGWWGLDEAIISNIMHNHPSVVFLDHGWVQENLQGRKICRGSGFNYDVEKLKSKYYWTAHMPRPLSKRNNMKRVQRLLRDMEP